MMEMWLRLGALTSKETVLSFIFLSPNKHSCKVELETVRFSAFINIQYQYKAVLMLILNILQSRHSVLIKSRLHAPRLWSSLKIATLLRLLSHHYRHLRDPWRGVVDVGCSLDSAKASEASCATSITITSLR